jgi:hypothetical protein
MAKDNNTKVEEDQDILDDDDRKPADVVFTTAGNVNYSLVATTYNETQSLAVGTVTQTLAGNDNQSLAAMASNVTQSLAATASNVAHSTVASTGSDVAQSLAATAINVAQSLAVTTINVAQSLAATASNVAHSNVAATGSVDHSTTFTEANTEAGIASFSPEMIAYTAATREMLLEMPPLTPKVIEPLLAIFHPIICLQLLTVLPFIHRWLHMILPLGKK